MADLSAPNPEALRRLEQLQTQLASRESTVHFAHAAVALVVALLGAGATGKLFWDLPGDKLLLGAPASVVVALLAIYGVFRYLKGKRVLVTELEQYELLKALRRDLRLDDPSALLPR